MKLKGLILALGLMILSGCSSHSSNEDEEGGVVRKKTMEEAAMAYGAQSALSYYGTRFNAVAEASFKQFDEIYNFNRFILSNNVMPPVVRQSRHDMSTSGLETLRLSDRTIEIVKPARFVTVPPSWRDYVLLNIHRPDVPDERLWPKTDEEYAKWVAAVDQGWHQGKAQTDSLIRHRLGLLKQDYMGIILYHELLAQNMISKPMVGRAKLGVTGHSGALRLNDQVLRITANSDLNTSPQTWKPVVVPGQGEPQRFATHSTPNKGK